MEHNVEFYKAIILHEKFKTKNGDIYSFDPLDDFLPLGTLKVERPYLTRPDQYASALYELIEEAGQAILMIDSRKHSISYAKQENTIKLTLLNCLTDTEMVLERFDSI